MDNYPSWPLWAVIGLMLAVGVVTTVARGQDMAPPAITTLAR